ncbi:prolipoprotein diacylglyceryl transferase [Aeromicrobium duanguangcaii]|uniref:Phosphatidylglycerol--prolipoprotein diacylglyceryl transferase n=1 Tax=Aeromicrobium duanguangcaii TaxID=2968086 RepID=A0ABY5KKX5_9ACTN|nr:prolipoprotein diacylglyceryl transferase [Aeromicrobium duanguangcaii]MCD9153215.1 prolipoprotein diacylglyceryl transferase [Aeromicrobium duanguangcaii]MCL3836792.1 prolipoprotein diacylglyceryl transferase [Aeromicrobium duanguangcaii]UUI69685.1 prolipoprotein diacylglyceryl transferase [Aeromicrobium duanguangcaii]
MTIASYIPSPDQAVWHLGPFPLRAYALCIIAGAVAAIFIAERRFVARGGRAGAIGDIAVWAIPFGIVGGRIYHVITDAELYFGPGRDPIDALKIWEGGLGIWGAVAFGGVGAWIACRRYDIDFLKMADALAPGLLVAQAIGRFGNYFNQELFGKPTTQPWGLEIDRQFRPDGYEQFATFHPTFLYEALWNLAAAVLLVWLDRRLKLTHGRVFALYVMLYTLGRGWIEMLRIDTVNHLGPFRLNVWTSIIVFCAGLAYFLWARRRYQDEPADTPA